MWQLAEMRTQNGALTSRRGERTLFLLLCDALEPPPEGGKKDVKSSEKVKKEYK